MLARPILEDLPDSPPHAFCPWFSGRRWKWGRTGESALAKERNFQGTLHEYLATRNNHIPLIVAIQSGDDLVARRLLELGVQVNAAELEGETALHMASALGKVELVRLLCEFHADVSALTEEGSTPLLHCARFCRSPDDAIHVTNLLLDHGADPTRAIEECNPLFFALTRPLIPLAEHLIPLMDISQRTIGNSYPYLEAALDALRKRHRIDSLNLLLQHASSHLQTQDIMRSVAVGGLSSQSAWLRDHAVSIGAAVLMLSRLHRWSSSETISILDRAIQYGLNPSDVVEFICVFEDSEVLKWTIDKGARLTVLTKEELVDTIRGFSSGWKRIVLQAWESEISSGARDQAVGNQRKRKRAARA